MPPGARPATEDETTIVLAIFDLLFVGAGSTPLIVVVVVVCSSKEADADE